MNVCTLLYSKAYTVSCILQVFSDMCNCVCVHLHRIVTPTENVLVFHLFDEESTPKALETTGRFYSLCNSAFVECQRIRIIHSLCDLLRVAFLPRKYAVRILPCLYVQCNNSSLLQLSTVPSQKHQDVPSRTPAEGPMSRLPSQLCNYDESCQNPFGHFCVFKWCAWRPRQVTGAHHDTSMFSPNEADELFLRCPPCFIVPPATNQCHHGSVLSNLWCCHCSSHSDNVCSRCNFDRGVWHRQAWKGPPADLWKSNSAACWVTVFGYKLDKVDVLLSPLGEFSFRSPKASQIQNSVRQIPNLWASESFL